MFKFAIIGGVGTASAFLLGVGMSFAHSGGLFGPSEPDWLTIRQQMTVTVPAAQASAPAVVKSPVMVAPVAAVATPEIVDDAAPTQVVAIAPIPQTFAPTASISPQGRPELAVVVAPTLSQPTARTADVQPVYSGPAVTEPVRIQPVTPVRRIATDQSLLAPPDVAQSAPNPVDNMWFLGVFR